MDEINITEVSKRAEHWKKNNGIKANSFHGRIVTKSIIAITLSLCVMLVAFVDSPITINMRNGLKSALSSDLNIKKTLGDVFYIDSWSGTDTQVNSNATVDDLLYMPAIGTETSSNDNDEKSISIACTSYIGIYATTDGIIEDIVKPTQGSTIILLRHSDNMLSVYNGCDQLYVKKGQKVNKKQLLCTVAKSDKGYVLKYELLKDNVTLDPMDYIEYEGGTNQ